MWHCFPSIRTQRSTAFVQAQRAFIHQFNRIQQPNRSEPTQAMQQRDFRIAEFHCDSMFRIGMPIDVCKPEPILAHRRGRWNVARCNFYIFLYCSMHTVYSMYIYYWLFNSSLLLFRIYFQYYYSSYIISYERSPRKAQKNHHIDSTNIFGVLSNHS